MYINYNKWRKYSYSAYVNRENNLRTLKDSFYEKISDFNLQRGESVELTGSWYKSNKEWNNNISKARSYAESLD